ncbi:hypothetical protein RFI_22472, partial [Reticulomyxa filosa]
DIPVAIFQTKGKHFFQLSFVYFFVVQRINNNLCAFVQNRLAVMKKKKQSKNPTCLRKEKKMFVFFLFFLNIYSFYVCFDIGITVQTLYLYSILCTHKFGVELYPASQIRNKGLFMFEFPRTTIFLFVYLYFYLHKKKIGARDPVNMLCLFFVQSLKNYKIILYVFVQANQSKKFYLKKLNVKGEVKKLNEKGEVKKKIIIKKKKKKGDKKKKNKEKKVTIILLVEKNN